MPPWPRCYADTIPSNSWLVVIQAHCAFGRFKAALNSEALHGCTMLAVNEVLEEAYALVEHEMITT